VTGGAAHVRPRVPRGGWRTWCLVGAVVVAVVALIPPLSTWARRTEYGSALQYSLFAIVLPGLVTLGAPWRTLHLARDGEADGPPRILDRVADRRRRHRELPWSLAFVAAGLGVAIAWHTPAAVAAVAAHGWLAPVEGATLVLAGVGLWLELVDSPPLVPRSSLLRRAVLGAFSMWTFWILAYVTGFSTHGFYESFHHSPGGLSAAADEQIASAVLWAVAAVAFMPVIFSSALKWLQSEEDPDAELLALARDDRRRGLPPYREHRGGAA
jgi:cytochrome c oxidase assembly factor CtaG